MFAQHFIRLTLLLLAAVSLARGQADGSRRWAFTTGGIMVSSPAAGPDGTLYFGTQDRYIYALAPGGAFKWRFLTGDWVDSTPAVAADGTVYAGSWDGKLYALNPNGTKKWDYATGAFITSSPAIALDGTIYVGSGDFRLHAINPDGSPKWTFLTGDWIDSSPAIGADGTVYIGSWDGSLYAVSSAGQLVWSYQTGWEIISPPALGADGTVYIGSRDGKLYALSPAGAKLWDFTTGDAIESSPVVGSDGSIYITSIDGKLYALNAAGVQQWVYTAASSLVSTPALRGTSLVVGTSDSAVVALSLATGALLWSAPVGDWVDSAPLVTADGRIYVGCYDKKLYALNGNGQPLSAGAPWPAFHRDTLRQGRAPAMPPVITAQPVGQAAVAGSALTLSVASSGTAPLGYQWYKNSQPLNGATSSAYLIAAASSADAGSYYVVVSNAAGTATSDVAVLTVSLLSQTITFTTPADQVYGAGPVTLGATASSALPVTFSLLSGPATLDGNLLTLVSGSGTVVVRADQAGNGIYAPAPSVDRTLTVIADFTAWQQMHFTADELADITLSGPNAVFGVDGCTNLVKYALGLDPKQNVTAGVPGLNATVAEWVYNYTRPAGLTDVTFTAEVSTDLVTWTSSGVTHELVSSAGGTETWRARYPLDSAANVFFRLKITRITAE